MQKKKHSLYNVVRSDDLNLSLFRFIWKNLSLIFPGYSNTSDDYSSTLAICYKSV
jgi:hypothetical protein